VLEHPARRQPEGIFLIGDFRRRLVRQGEDHRLAVRVSIELEARSGFDVGVGALTVAPQGLLALDHGPAQAAYLVVRVERGEVVAVAATELGVLLEQALLRVEAKAARLVVA
jgi:hypothetical protein